MISAEFVGGPWCGELRMLQDLVQGIEVLGANADLAQWAKMQQEPPEHGPLTYTVGVYELRPHQTHAGPYWYDWRPA